MPLISSPVQGQFPGRAARAPRSYPYLVGLKLADDRTEGETQIDVLVGADQYWNFVTGEVIRGESAGALSGPAHDRKPSSNTAINLTSIHLLKCQVTERPDPDILESKLEKFWRLESLGIVPNESSVYDEFQQRTCFESQRYEVSLR